MDDIVWWCERRDDAEAVLAEFAAYLLASRRLQLKPGAQARRSDHGIAFCGFRVRPGVVLPGPRKLARYRAGCRRLIAAETSGDFSQADLQRAHDALHSTLAQTQSTGFRQRLWRGT
jgi:hypothetical protein